MKIIETTWTPKHNVHRIECDCFATFDHRVDRWAIKCPRCGKVESLYKLRLEWVEDQKELLITNRTIFQRH